MLEVVGYMFIGIVIFVLGGIMTLLVQPEKE